MLYLFHCRFAPSNGALGGAQNQLQHRAPFFDAVDRTLPMRQTFGKVDQLGGEGVDGIEGLFLRFSFSLAQQVKRIFGAEDLPLLANDVNLVRAERQRERTAREDL